MIDRLQKAREMRQHEIAKLQKDLEIIEKALEIAGNTRPPMKRSRKTTNKGGRITIKDGAEQALRTTGSPLHINQIHEHLKSSCHLDVSKESVVSALARWIAQGRVFERTAPGVYGLLEWKNTPPTPFHPLA